MQGEKYVIYIETEEILFRHTRGMYERVEKEFHTQYELFYLYAGNVEFVSEYGRKKVEPGTLVVVPKECIHQFVVQDEGNDYTRGVFKFGDIEEFSDLQERNLGKVLFRRDEEIGEMFRRLRELTFSKMNSREKKVLLRAYFAVILVGIKAGEDEVLLDHDDMNAITRDAINYIGRNLEKDITLEKIADELHVSAAHLSRIFKRDMHISVHKYIMDKRLILAGSKLRNGMPAIQAAAESGFRDYSNFYVQYKRKFGMIPSRTDR